MLQETEEIFMSSGSEFQKQDLQADKSPKDVTFDSLRMTPIKIAGIYALVGIGIACLPSGDTACC